MIYESPNFNKHDDSTRSLIRRYRHRDWDIVANGNIGDVDFKLIAKRCERSDAYAAMVRNPRATEVALDLLVERAARWPGTDFERRGEEIIVCELSDPGLRLDYVEDVLIRAIQHPNVSERTLIKLASHNYQTVACAAALDSRTPIGSVYQVLYRFRDEIKNPLFDHEHWAYEQAIEALEDVIHSRNYNPDCPPEHIRRGLVEDLGPNLFDGEGYYVVESESIPTRPKRDTSVGGLLRAAFNEPSELPNFIKGKQPVEQGDSPEEDKEKTRDLTLGLELFDFARKKINT